MLLKTVTIVYKVSTSDKYMKNWSYKINKEIFTYFQVLSSFLPVLMIEFWDGSSMIIYYDMSSSFWYVTHAFSTINEKMTSF